MNWGIFSEKALSSKGIMRDEAMAILKAPDKEIVEIMAAAYAVRYHFYENRVNLHLLNNAKSGSCSENCSFCSQSAFSHGDIPRYSMKSPEEIIEGVEEAVRVNAVKYCIVISGRAPSEKELEAICQALREIKKRHTIHLCVSPGLLSSEQARTLKEAGADRINHNLETSRHYFPSICTTHTYDDRIQTIKNAQSVGLEVCCGGLMGMGESLEDRVELAFTLRELGVNSIPVNFLNPREGTPLETLEPLSPMDCLRILAMFRFVNPERDIRCAGGRETNVRQLQPLALYAANSIFTQGYLTTDGQGYSKDMEMIEDMGFCTGSIEY